MSDDDPDRDGDRTDDHSPDDHSPDDHSPDDQSPDDQPTDDDPFERLEADEAREGDPFERFVDEDRDGGEAQDDRPIDPYPWGEPDVDADDAVEEPPDGDDPFARRDRSTGDGSQDQDDPWEQVDPSREDDPWERVDPSGEDDPWDLDEFSGGDAAARGDDPWADISPPATESAGSSSTSRPDRSEQADQWTEPESSAEDSDDPFSGVETPAESPFDDQASAFESAGSTDIDPDQVWEDITSEDDDEDSHPMPDDGRYSEVSKHSFCEQCEYFSAPPDVECSHETAEIIEFLDMETVRLLDCPVVAEREALERGE